MYGVISTYVWLAIDFQQFYRRMCKRKKNTMNFENFLLCILSSFETFKITFFYFPYLFFTSFNSAFEKALLFNGSLMN